MSEGFQEALCALVTDGRLRGRLRAEGAPALAAFALAPDEAAALAVLDAEALERFAGSLLVKRSEELGRALPWSCRVAPTLPARYRALLGAEPSTLADGVLGPGLREALRLLAPLRRALDGDEAEAPFAGDVLVLETLSLCSRADGRVRFATLGHDLGTALEDLRRGLVPVDIPARRVALRCDRAGLRLRPE